MTTAEQIAESIVYAAKDQAEAAFEAEWAEMQSSPYGPPADSHKGVMRSAFVLGWFALVAHMREQHNGAGDTDG